MKNLLSMLLALFFMIGIASCTAGQESEAEEETEEMVEDAEDAADEAEDEID